MPTDLDLVGIHLRASQAIPEDETMRCLVDHVIDENDEDPQCVECGAHMGAVEEDLEPLAICERCAQVLVVEYAKKLRQAEEDRRALLDKLDCHLAQYTLCHHCDHFVDVNVIGAGEFYHDDPLKPEGVIGLARFVHLDDGEQEYDHNADPSSFSHGLVDWRVLRPDLFVEHPDGKIGPNSKHHRRWGKED